MFIIKVGGNEIDDADFLSHFAQTVATLDLSPIIIHGGGKEIADLQIKLGLTPRFVEGLRVTDDASLTVTEMVLCGSVNKRIVVRLLQAGVEAIGLSGVDRGLVRVEKMQHPSGDLGRVGRVVSVRGEILRALVEQHVVPVIAPISLGTDGAYNVNADSVACAIASAVSAEAVIFVTNVPGVMENGAVIPSMTAHQANALIKSQVIRGGMIPKVRAALDAVAAGACAARITDLAGLKSGTGTVVISD